MKAIRLPALLGVLMVVGCLSSDVVGVDDPWEGIELRTDRTSYRLGDEGVLTLENGYRHAILIHPRFCPLRRDRRVESGWEFAGPTDWACTSEGFLVEPGESLSMPFVVHEETFRPLGTFRFRITWGHSGAPPWGPEEGPPPDWPPWPWEVTTHGFTVEGGESP